MKAEKAQGGAPGAPRPVAFWRQVALVLGREWRLEWRRPETSAGVFFYALLLVVLFTLAVDPFVRDPKPVAASVLWLAYFFAAQGGISRSYARERDGGALLGLAAAPFDPAALALGKWLFGTLVVAVAEAVLTPVFLSLIGFSTIASPAGAAVALALGTVGLTAVASLVALVATGLRGGELLPTLLALPLLSPVAMGGVRLLDGALTGGGLGPAELWLRLLGAYDIIFLALLALLAPYALEG
ncbi:MAG: heme exporter protein CcmB [Clostridia bacterium]|nr:heme exporter protein CcmB [Clostridia bacterium]